MQNAPTSPDHDGHAPSEQHMFIHEIGTAVPSRALTQEEAVERMRITCRDTRTHNLIRRIARQSMIATRSLAALDWQDAGDGQALYRPAEEQPHGPGMGTRNRCFEVAASQLVRDALAGIRHESLANAKSLVTVSCTHASSPGLERPILEMERLSPMVQRWNLGFMGCSAGLAALRLIHGLTPSQQYALVCTCELSSLHFQYSDAIDQITANTLFADGAAGVVLSPLPSDVAVLDCRCVYLPGTAEQMIWFADDHGLRLTLSRKLPSTLSTHLGTVVDAFLNDSGRDHTEITHWLVHPGGPQILDAVESVLDLSADRLADSRSVLRDYGNMSSSTIFFILQRLIERRESGLGVALAFGPGLTIELALLEFKYGQ